MDFNLTAKTPSASREDSENYKAGGVRFLENCVSILFTVSLPIALAVLPYQVWVGVAASLSWGYRALN
jgi:hypothetical protein